MATNKIKSTWTGRGCLLVLAVTLTLGSQAATAQTETDDAVVLIVLDVSGSMGRAGADGTVLLDAAKEAVTELTASLPDDIDSGLRLYGHRTGQAESDKPEGCQDTELVVPVGQGSPDTVAAALQPLQPSGYTPIGTSLQQAAQDLGSASQATIVLVSDGEDSCQPPDPCEVAGELSEQGVDVVIDTVGLLLDTAEADSQLSCIAEATGGSFVTADDAASLGVALQEASSRAQRRYEVSGEPIEGAAVPFEAPDLQPGVQYVDEVRGDETLFYAIADLGPGDVFDVEIVREGVPDATGVFRVYTYLVDRDDNELGPDTCCTSQDLDTADVTALRNVEIAEDVDQAFIRIDTAASSGADLADLQRLQLRVVPAGGTAPSPSATPTASPTPAPTPTETSQPSPTSTPTPTPTPTATPSPSATPTDSVSTSSPTDGASPVVVDPAETAETEDGLPPWLLVLLAFLVLAVLGLGAYVVRLQQRANVSQSTPPPPPQ